jgi:hypothetical protein
MRPKLGTYAALALFPLLAIGCECGITPVAEQRSLDRAYVASMFERNCGATTDYATAINLRSSEEEFVGAVRDDVLRVSGLPPLEMHWEGARRLVVRLPALRGKEEIFQQLARWRDVDIVYHRSAESDRR